jgi:hypothetical protein
MIDRYKQKSLIWMNYPVIKYPKIIAMFEKTERCKITHQKSRSFAFAAEHSQKLAAQWHASDVMVLSALRSFFKTEEITWPPTNCKQ